MTQGFIESLPPELVAHVKAGCGKSGQAWLDQLASIITVLESEWSISVKEPFPGIEYNFVAPAIGENGEPVVIKIAPPWDPVEIHGEAAYLRDRNGVGCVRLIAEVPEHRAILIEQIFPGRSVSDYFRGREPDALRPSIDALKAVSAAYPMT